MYSEETTISCLSKNTDIILASGSARRKEIFEAHGFDPVIAPMDVDETLPEGIPADDAVMFLSLKKGLAAEEAFAGKAHDCEHALVVSADTIVYALDITTGRWTIMGKPKDDDDAWRMLSSIRGTTHKVMTGVTIIDISCEGRLLTAPKITFCDETAVYVSDVSDEDLQAYIGSGEPYGKAGGYAIQLGFGKYIDHIEGDYENVVGFPFSHFMRELTGHLRQE